jgi:hypothetical protein
VGEDDFGGDVGGVRFIDTVLARDFANQFIRIASPEFDVHFVGCSVHKADTDHAVVDFDRNSKAFAEYFCHEDMRTSFRIFFKKFIRWSKPRQKTQSFPQ